MTPIPEKVAGAKKSNLRQPSQNPLRQPSQNRVEKDKSIIIKLLGKDGMLEKKGVMLRVNSPETRKIKSRNHSTQIETHLTRLPTVVT